MKSDQAFEWHYQLYQSQKVWLHRAILGLVILLVLLFLSMVSHLALLPLKQNTPFLYTTHHKTGELVQVGAFKAESFEKNWLMSRFLIHRYVENRESYDSEHLERPYQIAWAMSDDSEARKYTNLVRTDNPKSPYALYGKDQLIDIHILSINKLNQNTAQVRFEKRLRDRNTRTEQVMPMVAILKWRYTEPITTQKMLERDPLGFKVFYYQVSHVQSSN